MLNYAHYALNMLVFMILGRTFYRYTLPLAWRPEAALGRLRLPLRRWSRCRGAYLCSGKDAPRDYLEINRQSSGDG